MFNSASMEGRVGPLRLSVNPNTKKVKKQPAVSSSMVVLDDLFCMMDVMERTVIHIFPLAGNPIHKKYPMFLGELLKRRDLEFSMVQDFQVP